MEFKDEETGEMLDVIQDNDPDLPLELDPPGAGRVGEVRQNLAAKLPEAGPLFEEFLRAVRSRSGRPTAHDHDRAHELADAKEVPILAAAIGGGARILVTHNIRHFRSGQGVRVMRPRTLIEEARAWMGSLGT